MVVYKFKIVEFYVKYLPTSKNFYWPAVTDAKDTYNMKVVKHNT